jgi:hypothetical protein
MRWVGSRLASSPLAAIVLVTLTSSALATPDQASDRAAAGEGQLAHPPSETSRGKIGRLGAVPSFHQEGALMFGNGGLLDFGGSPTFSGGGIFGLGSGSGGGLSVP